MKNVFDMNLLGYEKIKNVFPYRLAIVGNKFHPLYVLNKQDLRIEGS